jgi:two-component system KDP operon response regulator KdpE
MESDEKKWVYQRNGLTVDLRSCEVFVHGEEVQLTGTEYKLLTYLIDRRGWVLSQDQILSHVWGSDYVGEKSQVKLYIWYLRQKLENDPRNPQMIVTRRGLGYTFAG